MKNLRLILWVGLVLAVLVNYSTWVAEFAPRDAAAAAAAQKAAEAEKSSKPLGAAIPQVANVPAAGTPAGNGAVAAPNGATAPANGAVPTAASPTAAGQAGGKVVSVRTDVLDVDLNLRGGELQRADLLAYPMVKGQPTPVRLLRNVGPGDQYLLQTGLAGTGPDAATAYPTHQALFEGDFSAFVLQDGSNEIDVPLVWTSPAGVKVTKTLVFRRGSYRIDVQYQIENGSMMPWSAASYAQILHDLPAVKRSYFNVDSYSFTGPAFWDGGKYKKLKITNKEDASLNRDIKDGWMASLQHHFVVAMIPKRDETDRYTLSARDDEYVATIVGPTITVAPGATANVTETLFVGPKLQTQLEAIHPELGRAADFGVLTFLSRPLFWLLSKAHLIFNNWGLAIIAVTFLLKLVFYPLAETSGRSMAKMKLIQPRLKQIQETYKDDRQKLGQAMMELYKKEKVNPAAGCLPQLVQIPVFIAFYWVLLESVEMRQAPFFGWLQDISSRDPYYILPLIMAGAMFVQYKLNPAPPDPVQAKVMMILPLVMSVTFAFFPSGLVLYYVVNTLLTIAQQWNINRRIAASQAARN
jgi:YidC/Oxa1 family membrane protein insertase